MEYSAQDHTYRQMADCDTLRASNDLRTLRAYNLLASKGKGKSTYYVAGPALAPLTNDLSAPPPDLSAPAPDLSAPAQDILDRINELNQREHDTRKIENIIVDLCRIRPMKALEIAGYLSKGEGYVKRK